MPNGCAAIHIIVPTWTFVKTSWGIIFDNSNVLQDVTPVIADRSRQCGEERGDDDDDARHHEFNCPEALSAKRLRLAHPPSRSSCQIST